jgi:hypothetical protein
MFPTQVPEQGPSGKLGAVGVERAGEVVNSHGLLDRSGRMVTRLALGRAWRSFDSWRERIAPPVLPAR